MHTDTLRRLRLVVYIITFCLAVIILYTLFQTPAPALARVVRGAALFGYVMLFWVIVSSEYMRGMRKLFGRPFLKVHHFLMVIAWLLIVIHPLTVALRSNSLAVFVPIFSPFREFLVWAGRPALYLFALATLAARLRSSIKSTWKFIHWLNYLAFLLVFVHAWLLGTDVASGLLRVIWAAMAGIVLLVFLHKRLGGT